MARQKKVTDKAWLNQAPPESEIELSPFGGHHIPIHKLRPLLDRINATSRNYKTQVFKDNYSNLVAHGSLELTAWIDGKERTVIGAYNLVIGEAINGFWNGTLKSECIKNAAMEFGKRLGRELNKDAVIEQPTVPPSQNSTDRRFKPIPDANIMAQYKAAIERGEEATITLLNNLYQIEKDATQRENIGN